MTQSKTTSVDLPTIGSRWWFTWRERFGTVVDLPYGTCVDAKLDTPSVLPPGDDVVALFGRDWEEGIRDGSIVPAAIAEGGCSMCADTDHCQGVLFPWTCEHGIVNDSPRRKSELPSP